MFDKRPRLKPNRDQELRVAAAILASSHDPRAKQLFDQMARRRRNLREERSDGFVVTVPKTTDEPLVDLDEDVQSSWVRVADRQSNQVLEFRVTLRGGGFHSLEGRAVEGPWPKNWHVSDVALGQAALEALQLPGPPPPP